MLENYYKYLPINRINYLENELLRFTQPGDLNDPFECLPQKPSIEEFNNLIESLASIMRNAEIKVFKEKFNSSFYENLIETQYKKVNEDIGIFSLSKNWKNSLMWAHYTESHNGFCIGFDSQHSFFKDYLGDNKDVYRTLKDVIYSDTRVQIPMILGQKKLDFEPYITKSLDWKYEEEVRLIRSLKPFDDFENNIPFDIYLFKVPHSAIKEIILGANINIENELKIKEFATKRNIKLWKSKLSESTFNMERE